MGSRSYFAVFFQLSTSAAFIIVSPKGERIRFAGYMVSVSWQARGVLVRRVGIGTNISVSRPSFILLFVNIPFP